MGTHGLRNRTARPREIKRRHRLGAPTNPLVGFEASAVTEHFPSRGGVTKGLDFDAARGPTRGQPFRMRSQHRDAIPAAHERRRHVADEGARAVVLPTGKRLGQKEEVEALPMPGDLRDLVLDVQTQERELLAPDAAREYLVTTARHRPVALGELVAYKAARSWYGTETFRFEGAIVAIQVVWVGLAVAGAELARRRSTGARWYVWLVAAITLCSWAGAMAVLSIVRYLVPTLGLFAPVVAVALLAMLDHARSSRGPAGSGAPRPTAA